MFSEVSEIARVAQQREQFQQLLKTQVILILSINLLVVYRESVNLIGYITRRLSADSQQL